MPKMKKGQTVAECGCTCDASRWLTMCDTHRKESNGIHRRWNEERAERALPPIDLPTIKLPEETR